VQLGVVNALTLIQQTNEQLRQALVSIRRSKVMRQEYRRAVEVAGLSSKEPTHPDSPTRWNSTREMGVDATAKRFTLDSIMEQFKDSIGCGALSDEKWKGIGAVSTFLRVPRQVMESLAADRKSTLDLVSMSFTLLIKHCDDGEAALNAVNPNLTAAGMKEKLLAYEKMLVQEPAIVASFLNPQTPKPTDPKKLAQITGVVCAVLQPLYSGQKAAQTRANQEPADTLFSAMFQPKVSAFRGDEVDDYLAYGTVNASKFNDVLQLWSARKNSLPTLYTVDMEHLGTPATSNPSERVSSAAGLEFTSARQSLSSSIFIQTMCLRS
jgi:hAT family C-terminal dimerisation region